ncbi:hypothetical protein [Variovorax sp. LjRoot178]|uniref:hypothetical protein n=1 Tax=Variovorax sp. LjRoot178 TaxID=3342277 RepID=UPI003ECC51AE
MQITRLDLSFFPASVSAELLRLVGQLDLAIYTADASDFCAPPMGNWHFIGPAGLSRRQLELQTSWFWTIQEAVEEFTATLARFLKSQGS